MKSSCAHFRNSRIYLEIEVDVPGNLHPCYYCISLREFLTLARTDTPQDCSCRVLHGIYVMVPTVAIYCFIIHWIVQIRSLNLVDYSYNLKFHFRNWLILPPDFTIPPESFELRGHCTTIHRDNRRKKDKIIRNSGVENKFTFLLGGVSRQTTSKRYPATVPPL